MTPEQRKELRTLLRSLASNLKTTNRGLALQDDAYRMASSLYSEEEKEHVRMMASRHGFPGDTFADALSQNGFVNTEFWLDAREA